MQATPTTSAGHTGREVVGDQTFARAKEWAQLQGDELLGHSIGEEFRDIVARTSCIDGTVLSCYRGRPAQGELIAQDRMGPPRLEDPCPPGRYNRTNERVLYLCDTKEGVLREIASDGGLCIQRYILPLSHLRIADFTWTDIDSLVNAVFEIAESCNVDERGPKSCCRDCLRALRWDESPRRTRE